MDATRRRTISAMLLGLALLAACSHRPKPQPAPAPIPTPAPTAAPAPINAGLGAEEALWHVRAALNVAALSCRDPVVVARYNQLLGDRRALLAAAYAAESDRFRASHGSGWQAALDTHMTQVYNFFADPRSRAGFCAAALQVEADFAAPDAALATLAPAALRRLESPPAPVLTLAARSQAAEPAGGTWLIQLGAYSGRAAAETAWQRIGRRLSGVANLQPRYEPVPGKLLVRLRIGPVADRRAAIGLCAAAAGAGLDCFPVAGS